MDTTLYHYAYMALIATFIVVGLIVGLVNYQQRKQRSKQLARIALIKSVKKLILLLQRHRGFAAGFNLDLMIQPSRHI